MAIELDKSTRQPIERQTGMPDSPSEQMDVRLGAPRAIQAAISNEYSVLRTLSVAIPLEG